MAAPNFTFAQALNAYNNDQVMTQTMWYVEPIAIKENYLSYMQIYGQNFTVPARTNEFAPVSYRGYEIPTPTVMKMDQDHTITINADVHHYLRRGFLNWQARAIDPRITLQESSFSADRRPTAGVGESGLRLYLLAPNYTDAEMKIRMYGVRVQNVGPISLSNTDGGIATFEVGFKSVYWETETTPGNDEDENVLDSVVKTIPGASFETGHQTGKGLSPA